MSRGEAWLLHVANLLVGGTGLVYAVLRYFVPPADPFSAVHPWLPPAQHAHVWTAPLLVFGLGLVWRTHALTCRRLGIAQRHRSGTTLLVAAIPMAASGYFLQTAVDPSWRSVWVAVHLTASGLWLLGYLAHQLSSRPAR